jgi:thiol:disulfide interchange protein
MKSAISLIVTLSFCLNCILCYPTARLKYTPIVNNKSTVIITLPIAKDDYIYKEYLSVSIDHPTAQLSAWKTNCHVSQKYDPYFKNHKKVFTKSLTITLDIQIPPNILILDPLHLYMTYYRKSDKQLRRKMFTLSFENHTNKTIATSIDTDSSLFMQKPITRAATPEILPKKNIKKCYSDLSNHLSHAIHTSKSFWLQIMLSCILGLFCSLTPCIYPMIPATGGILHAYSSTSILYNFCLFLSYAVGLSTIFTLLGTIEIYTAKTFGSFAQHPFFFVGFVLLLLYLAGTMFNFYTMYIPPFLKNTWPTHPKRFFVFAFALGALSSIITSPCISPELITILKLVATINSYLKGSFLLFAFVIGLSIPLLLISFVSNSLVMLPKSGYWTPEIKKLFGFVLIGTSLYLLKPAIPLVVTLLCTCTLLMAGGIYCLLTVTDNKQKQLVPMIKNILGFFLLASVVVVSFKGYQSTCDYDHANNMWKTHYLEALNQAKKEHKLLLLDISTSYCSLCTKAKRNILDHDAVITYVKKFTIPVKISPGRFQDKQYAYLEKKYKIRDFPTILLIDPISQIILNEWNGKLYQESPETFIAHLDQFITNTDKSYINI